MPTLLLPLAALLLSLAAPAARADVTVVEYHHSGFDHYFITPVPDEIAKLDAHAPPFELWSRTGRTFRAYDGTAAPAGAVAICRFFNSSFAPKSSHFYAPKGLGCEDTLAKFPDWGLEDDRLFATMLPDAAGACPAGTIPVYRLYNNGQGGAPNHRFVTSLADRQAMLDLGYLAEGAGIGVGMCVPGEPPARTTAEGLWKGVTDKGQTVRILVLPSRVYFVTWWDPASSYEAGVAWGKLEYDGRSWVSSEVVYAPMRSQLAGAGSAHSATFTPMAILEASFGSSKVTASYDPGYDTPVDLPMLAGSYAGESGHRGQPGDPGSTPATIDAQGRFVIAGGECVLTGDLRTRPNVAVLDFTLKESTGPCAGIPTNAGVAFYDGVARKLSFATEAFVNPLYGFDDMYLAFVTRK